MDIPPGDEPGQAGWMNSARFLREEGVIRFCDSCGDVPRRDEEGTPIPLKRCSTCHHAWYHDRACQKDHYASHKRQCRVWAKTIKNEPRLEAYPFVEYHQQETAAKCSLYEGCRRDWDKRSETWDREARPWFVNGVFYHRIFLPICFSNDESRQLDVILDFGCATGTLTDYLRTHARKVISLDLSPRMIDKVRANEWDNVEAVAGCLADTDDPAIRELRETYRNQVDLIVATTVMPYIPPLQAKATFRAFHDLLKPGTGRLCHVDFSKETLEARWPNYLTMEECETFYQWGQLQREILRKEPLEITGPAGTVHTIYLVGVAKKP